MNHSRKKEVSLIINIALSAALLIAIVLIIKFGISSFDKKTGVSSGDLDTMGQAPIFTAYTTDFIMAELEGADSSVKITKELLEYIRNTKGTTAYADIVSYLDKKGEYSDEMWQELFGATLRVLDYLAHEGQEGYSDCSVINADSSDCTLAFIGDVVLDDVWRWSPLTVHKNNREDLMASAFSSDVISEMKNADILMANHSFAYRNSGTRNPLQARNHHYGSDKSNVSVLTEMGIDIVNIANYHTNDYQISAFGETLEVLKNAGIAYTGGGTDKADASSPRYFIAGGMKLAYVSMAEAATAASAPEVGDTASGVLYSTNTKLCAGILDTAAKNADYVIAYVDFSSFVSGDANSSEEQSRIARELIDRGADAVIGSSSTTLQEIEYYEGCPIVYGLGSFWQETDRHNTVIFKIVFEDQIPQFYCVPCVQSNALTVSAQTPEAATEIFEIITNPSMGKISIAEDGLVSEN